MASHLSPHPHNCPDDSQPESSLFQSSWFGGRSPLRTRRRVIFCLFVATFALIALYSHWQRPPGVEKYFESCQSLDPEVPCVPEALIDSPPQHTVTITQTAHSTTKTMIVEPPVQPVVFALIMYSESSAMEGAVLLKVLSSTLFFLDRCLV